MPEFAGYESGHETPETKRKFAEAFIRFVGGGFRQTAFHGPFYRQLSNTFGHIAHYNIHGFYEAQFSSTQARIEFVEQCLAYPCYGSPQFTYCDVESFLQQWLRSTGLVARLKQQRRDEIYAAETAQLELLKAKYEGPQSGTALLASLFS